MYVIGLLILVFLLVALLGKNRSPYARVIIGSVFGVGFLVLWPYVLFYARLFNWPELQLQITWLVLCVISTLAGIALAKLPFALPVAIVSFTVFALSAIASFSFEVQAKNVIAQKAGLFDQAVPVTQPALSPQDGTVFVHPSGYQLVLPAHWQLQKDQGDLFHYFQLTDGNTVIAELRPQCFDPQQAAIPDIAMQLQQPPAPAARINIQPYCYQQGEHDVTCRVVQPPQDKQVKRIHWLAVRAPLQFGVDLDFVFYREPAALENEMQLILASLQQGGASTSMGCLGTAAWF